MKRVLFLLLCVALYLGSCGRKPEVRRVESVTDTQDLFWMRVPCEQTDRTHLPYLKINDECWMPDLR